MRGRMIGDRFSVAFDTPMVVGNRPGATGVTGATTVARAGTDSYVFLPVLDGTVSIAPVLQENFLFDSLKDLAPVARLADVDLIIAANPDQSRPIPTNPRKLTYAFPGMGSTAEMGGELMRRKGGMNWVHIPSFPIHQPFRRTDSPGLMPNPGLDWLRPPEPHRPSLND